MSAFGSSRWLRKWSWFFPWLFWGAGDRLGPFRPTSQCCRVTWVAVLESGWKTEWEHLCLDLLWKLEKNVFREVLWPFYKLQRPFSPFSWHLTLTAMAPLDSVWKSKWEHMCLVLKEKSFFADLHSFPVTFGDNGVKKNPNQCHRTWLKLNMEGEVVQTFKKMSKGLLLALKVKKKCFWPLNCVFTHFLASESCGDTDVGISVQNWVWTSQKKSLARGPFKQWLHPLMLTES